MTDANKKISDFDPAAALTGAELIELVQSGVNVRSTMGAQVPRTGTSTNDNASTGIVGQIISSTVTFGSAVSVVTATAKTVTSISLTAGDWDVVGNVGWNISGTTSITQLASSISQTNNTLDTTPGSYQSMIMAAIVPGSSSTVMVSPPLSIRISLASTTTIYLIARGVFTVDTLAAFGTIRGRRMR